jgi:glycosyltransferase involved in cell wall biosynthesis
MHHHPLILFIVKPFHDYDGKHYVSYGLQNSARFVVEMLKAEGHRAKLVEAVDGNSIDALVTKHNPTRVVLEAIWVTPAKMRQLQKLHPKIRWTVRVHSETPFLANEGSAVGWIAEYLSQGISVGFNSLSTALDFDVFGTCTYLPNYYPLRKPRKCKPSAEVLDVGCFGAIRPMKNQLIQAIAAVKFARKEGKRLVLHMNGSRKEQGGDNNLKNIEALIAATGQTLVIHKWIDHDEFLELVAEMNICLQVSLSESFNITSADAASMGVPLVGSSAISWLPHRSRAQVHSADNIAELMGRANAATVAVNYDALETYLRSSVEAWKRWIEIM